MGNRCRYSKYGLEALQPRSGQREGEVVGKTVAAFAGNNLLKVRWDGNTSYSTFSVSFIEIIEPTAPAPPAEPVTTQGPWTDERVARLRELHLAGYSFGQIADRLCIEFDWTITRNAVIGKATRLGREKRRGSLKAVPTVRAPRNRKTHQRPIVSHPEPIANQTPDLALDQSEHPLTIMELENCHCRWPLAGEPSVSMLYCADPTADVVNGRPYCGRHAAIARQRGRYEQIPVEGHADCKLDDGPRAHNRGRGRPPHNKLRQESAA